MTMINPNSNPKPEKASDEVKKEFLSLHHRINSCHDYYTSKKDVELELQKLEIKYGNANLLLSNNPNDTTKHEIARLRRRISRMVDAKCSICGKRIVAPSSSYRKYEYYIECFECTCVLDRLGHEEYHNKWRKEAEVNPLMKYCCGINKYPEPYGYELSLTKEQLLKLNEDVYVNK